VRGRLFADDLQYLAALELAQPAANQWRQVAAPGLSQINAGIRGRALARLILRHCVHLLSWLPSVGRREGANIAQTSYFFGVPNGLS
jgi:hypothetical protein